MGNFFTDNEDILFNFEIFDLKKLATILENNFEYAKEYDYAPENAEDAVDNYRRVLTMLGELSAEFIEPLAESVDREGCHLLPDGTVKYAEGIQKDLDMLAKAGVMGFTLPYRFGGLNFPNLIYSIAIEIVSRADASLMNLFGLQGIAETINAYASEKIKEKYLPLFAEGKVTGAMVLTEPDAGSDLQAVKTRAYQDESGRWYINGVKRFITNGCGDILLVLARSEPDRAGGLGLSLFLVERGPTVKIRRLEDKLGIHGSPTCEIFFDNTPAELIGERQRGLVTYVMSLMNGARVGVAAQAVGIAEAAYRVARSYAASRRQFGVSIDQLPAVRDMLVDMKIKVEASRVLLYECSWMVDHHRWYEWQIETGKISDKEKLKELKTEARRYKRLADMLTPMCKYYASEVCNQIAYDAMQVLGGSGYMRDYPVERHYRDARITNIYEGTSQLQIVAAVRGVASGTAHKAFEEFASYSWPKDLIELNEKLKEAALHLQDALTIVKQNGVEYMDLYGRKIVDAACDIYLGYLFMRQALHSEKKKEVAERFINQRLPLIEANCKLIRSGDKSTFDKFDKIVGPPPKLD